MNSYKQVYLKLKKFLKYLKHFRDPTYQISLMKITKVAEHYDVNKLFIDQEYIWPYIRNDLTVALTAKYDYAKRHTAFSPYISQKGHISNLPNIERLDYKKLYDCIEIEDLESFSNIDYLFVTNLSSVEDVTIDNKIYKRLTDPLYERTLEFSNALKIEIIKFKTKNIKNIKNYYHPTIGILPPIECNKNYIESLQVDKVFIEKLQKYCPELTITKEYIEELVNWNMHTRDYWLNILKRIKPKVILTVGFHRAGPMISAARELGIVSVDIQHGVQSGWNPIYNNWKEMPIGGYQALPDYFAVWSEEDKKHITNIFHKGKSIKLGYPWLDRQQDFVNNELDKVFFEKCQEYETVVLLTMQREKKISSFIKDIIEDNSNTLWVIKSHPKGKKFQLNDFGEFQNIYISKKINEMGTGRLSEYINIHITQGSTMIKEMAYFNVPSILIDKRYIIYFKYEIEQHFVYKAFTRRKVKSIIKLLTNQKYEYSQNIISFDLQYNLKSLQLM